jgi:hypothetical protein
MPWGRKEKSSSGCPSVWPDKMGFLFVFTFKNDWRIEMKSFTVILFVMALSLVCMTGMAQAANLVTNGDFATDKSGWDTNGYFVDATDPTAYIPDPGALWLSADKHCRQVTGQTIAANEVYTLSFDAANTNEVEGSDPNVVHAWLYSSGDSAVLADSGSISLPGTATEVWNTYSFQFTTLAGQAYVGQTIGVEFATAGYGYCGVDNFSLTVMTVPEPAAIVLVVTGVIGLLCYAWRKRK